MISLFSEPAFGFCDSSDGKIKGKLIKGRVTGNFPQALQSTDKSCSDTTMQE